MARTSKLHGEEVLVVGLGRFGLSAAVELQRLGHRVTVVEKDAERAEQYAGSFAKVHHADATTMAANERARIQDFRIAVVAVGAIEPSVLVAANLVDAGVASVWATAATVEHGRILERIGVHHVVRPEADAGRRVAHLVNGRLDDYIEFDDGFAIVKMPAPQETIGFTFEQSQLRTKYGVTVIGVKSPGRELSHALPSTRVTSQDTLIVSGPTDLIERLAERP